METTSDFRFIQFPLKPRLGGLSSELLSTHTARRLTCLDCSFARRREHRHDLFSLHFVDWMCVCVCITTGKWVCVDVCVTKGHGAIKNFLSC